MESSSAVQTDGLSKNQRDALNAGAVYFGYDTVEHGDYIIGMEKLRNVAVEMGDMFNRARDIAEGFLGEDSALDLTGLIAMEIAYNLVLFVVRYKGHAVGFQVVVTYSNPSASNKETATSYGIFLEEEHRKGRLGMVLFDYTIKALTALGIDGVFMGDKSPVGAPPLGKFFERAGLELVSHVYYKRL